MKSRTSFFNGAVLKRLAFKGLPLWGAYLLIWLVLLPIMLYSGERWREALELREYILSTAAYSSQLFGAGYGLASACMVFSYLYKSRSANFFGALPLTRQTMFRTHYLAGLLFAVAPNLIVVVLSLPACLFWGIFLIKDLAIWFAVMTLTYLFYYSFAVLLAMIVGNLIALPVLYAILNFTAVVVEAIIRELLNYFIYGLYSSNRMMFDWASPLYYTVLEGNGPDVTGIWDEMVVTDYVFEGWPLVLIMGAIGVAFAVAAYFLHKYRRMESAGDVIAVRHLKPVFLYCFTVGCSIVLGYILANLLVSTSIGTEDFVAVLLCMIAGAFVGYFLGQMMLHKSVRVFRKRHWLNWAVTSLVITAAMLCVRFDMFGYARYVPDLDEVEAVSLGYGGDFNEDPAFMEQVQQLHQACLDRQHETEQMDPEDGYTQCYLSYKLDDGRVVERKYLLPISEKLAGDETSLIRMFEDAYNDPDYKVIRRLPEGYAVQDIESCQIYANNGQEVWLSKQDAYNFLKNYLEPDLRESSMENVSYAQYSPYYVEAEYCDINIEVAFGDSLTGNGYVNHYYFFSVTTDAARILEYAAGLGIEPTYTENMG